MKCQKILLGALQNLIRAVMPKSLGQHGFKKNSTSVPLSSWAVRRETTNAHLPQTQKTKHRD
jgi:hypothetical protein